MIVNVLMLCALIGLMVAASADPFSDYAEAELFGSAPPIPLPFSRVNITSFDGINLEALVFDTKIPKKSQPAIIFISSWGLNKYEYFVPARHFADLGYTVVSYTARGFWGSSQKRGEPGGEIDLARSKDIADVSAVIDWMLKNTHADANRIGLSGISYGGGISILASAFEPRVKSVVAMSCWVDLAESLLGQGNTIRTFATKELQGLAELTGTVGTDLQFLFDNYFANTNLDQVKELVKPASAVHVIDQIKTNNPSIFIANAWEDSLFTPNQFPSFFTSLTGPKHLEFAPGDHAGAELPGLFPQKSNYTKIFGNPGLVWDRAERWFNNYLMLGNTGEFTEYAPIIFNTFGTNNTLDSYNTWSEVTTSTKKFNLANRESLSPAKRDVDDVKNVSSAWNEIASITSGWGTISGGIAIITGTVEAFAGHGRPWDLKDIDRKYAAVFFTGKGDLGSAGLKIRGTPTLTLDIVPSSSQGTIIVYVLDVDEKHDFGTIITFAPYTFTGAKAGKSFTMNMDITLTSWDLLPGRRLALVIGTKDKLFLDQNPFNQDFKIGDGSFNLPLH